MGGAILPVCTIRDEMFTVSDVIDLYSTSTTCIFTCTLHLNHVGHYCIVVGTYMYISVVMLPCLACVVVQIHVHLGQQPARPV